MADIEIGGILHSTATGNTVARANEILDTENGNKKQSVINADTIEALAEHTSAIEALEGKVGSGGTVDERIAAEKTRAEGAEQTLATAISNKISKATGVTYSALKALRDGGTLVPGQFYRITDYTTTTTVTGTQSAGHLFDVVVMALDTSHLSENAYATHHDGDTYFTNCKVEAWKLKYCIDNDTARFAWADSTNGKGVIYEMQDEFSNKCPYDFKNIMFARYKITVFTKVTDLVNTYGGFTEIGGTTKYPSDATIDNTAVYRYTFDYLNGTTSNDLTVYQYTQSSYKCHGNVINPYYVNSQKKMQLNNITIGGNSYQECYGNEFGENCRNNSISYNAYGNRFGVNVYNNSIGNSVYRNSIGNWFTNNSIGNVFQNNSIGNNVYYNSIGNGFDSNSIGNVFQYNSIGNNFQYNSIGNNFQYNSIGNGFGYNSIGNDFGYNSIGNSFRYNSIGNSFSGNSIGNDFGYNSIGNWFTNNSIGNNVYYNSIGNACYGNYIGDYIYGMAMPEGISGESITFGIAEFDYGYDSWEESDGVSGVYGVYLGIQVSKSQAISGHVKVMAKHAAGIETMYDADITTDATGAWRIEDLSAYWNECDGDLCCVSYEFTCQDNGMTFTCRNYDSW